LINDVLLNEGVVDVAGDSFEVLQNTGSDMNVKVGSGTAGDKAVIREGGRVYIGEHSNATHTFPVAASDPSDDRIDRVVYRTYDDEADSSGNTYSDVEIIEGTPSGAPSAPALPSGAISLATIEVGAGVTAITDANITDLRSEATVPDNALLNRPWGQLGYVQTPSNVGPFSSMTTLASVAVTLPASRRIKLTGAWESWSSTVAGDRITFNLLSSVVRMEQTQKNPDSGVVAFGGTIVATFSTTSGGLTTISLRASRRSGTGSLTVIGNSTAPISLLVEDIGPS
jgi:hypothetical protein